MVLTNLFAGQQWRHRYKEKIEFIFDGCGMVVIEAAGSIICSHQFSSVSQSCPTLCDPMNRSTPGLPVHYQLPEFTQSHVH